MAIDGANRENIRTKSADAVLARVPKTRRTYVTDGAIELEQSALTTADRYGEDETTTGTAVRLYPVDEVHLPEPSPEVIE